MKVLFHPEFANDQKKFQSDYAEISAGLAARFQREIDDAIAAVKAGLPRLRAISSIPALRSCLSSAAETCAHFHFSFFMAARPRCWCLARLSLLAPIR